MEIETGIPLPRGLTLDDFDGRTSRALYTQVEVGQSFVVPGENSQGRTAAAAKHWGGRRTPRRQFTCAAVEGGVRIWRVR